MAYLCIRNKGEIDLAALMLLGATDKEGSNKIGFFGSGNKYAMATLLRNGCELRIFSGIKEFVIATKEVLFRDELYYQIMVDGKETSITTRMGPAWEVWMAIREFYCNAVDEGLISFGPVEEVQGTVEGETAIYVSLTEPVENFVNNMSDYINQQEPLVTIKTKYGLVDILPNTQGIFYRKNIRASNDEHVSLYSYNFDCIDINESRLINYASLAEEQMTCALAATESRAIIERYISNANNPSLLEYNTRWSEGYCLDKLSSVWQDILLEKDTPVMARGLSALIPESEIYTILPDALVQKIGQELPEVPIYGNKDGMFIAAEPTEELVVAVNNVLEELVSWGLPRRTINYCTFKCSSIKALVQSADIYVSIDISLDDLLPAIYEEYVHIDTGYSDCTRSLQSYLFKEIIKLNKVVFSK